MLADTIEAAVRSMKDPTPKGIDQFIERLIRGKLEDGQLSDCQLSLRDIDLICEAFSGILKGVYHDRIEYPKVQKFTVKEAASAGGPAQAPNTPKQVSVPAGPEQAAPSASAQDETPEPPAEVPPAAGDPEREGESARAD